MTARVLATIYSLFVQGYTLVGELEWMFLREGWTN
jgi:hypothetical protein